MHLNSHLLFEKYALSHFSSNSMVLEIGPDSFPSRYRILANEVLHWDTLEIESSNATQSTFVSKELYKYPIKDNTYDIVLAGQVMEHIGEIWTWLTELKRIVKKEGLIILISPTSWPYHEAPIDCWRIYPEGMKNLVKLTNLEIVELKCESLEIDLLKSLRHLNLREGRSCFHDTTIKGLKKINAYNALIKKIPIIKNLQLTTEIAFDLVTILRKRQ